tara:strand:- start:201 stop:893 length:693 start_codon:yes stop_codon:yes gene_type:complete
MKIDPNSNHPVALAYRSGRLENYNLITFGENRNYFFKYSKGILHQQKTRGHQYYYSSKFSYLISSPINMQTPRFANCMEFVQRVAVMMNVADACTFYKINIKPFTVTYLPYLKRFKCPSRTIEEIPSCKYKHSRETVKSILQQKDIEMHVVKMRAYWGVIPGPHFCLVFGKSGRYFSIAIGQIWSVSGESNWKNIFVSIPDPLILKCEAKVISSTTIEDATDLIPFFELT